MARMCAEVEARADELRPELCGAVPKLLAELKSTGKLLGVTSGNVERIGWAKLKAAGIGEYFSFGSFSDRNETARRSSAGVPKRRGGAGRRGQDMALWANTPADVAAAKALRLSGHCCGDRHLLAGWSGQGRAGDVHPRLRNPVELRRLSGIR